MRSPAAIGANGRLSRARTTVLDLADAVRDTIQIKPFLSVGVVLVAGLALGFSLGATLSGD